MNANIVFDQHKVVIQFGERLIYSICVFQFGVINAATVKRLLVSFIR